MSKTDILSFPFAPMICNLADIFINYTNVAQIPDILDNKSLLNGFAQIFKAANSAYNKLAGQKNFVLRLDCYVCDQ